MQKPDFVLAGHLSETREARLKTYIAVLAAFAAALCVSWIYAYGFSLDLRLVVGAAILACFILLGEVFSVQVSERTAISTGDLALIDSGHHCWAPPGPHWRPSLRLYS